MHRINLIPKEIILARNKKRKRFKYTAIVLLLIILGIFSFYFINREITAMDRYLDYAEKELAFLKYELNNLYNGDVNVDYIKIAKKFVDDLKEKRQIQRIQVIKNITEKTSENVTVESLKINESNNLVIEGKAENLQSIAKFMDSIKKAPFINDIKINYIKNTSDSIDDFVYAYAFQLTCRVIGD